jgi:hypothetical protein
LGAKKGKKLWLKNPNSFLGEKTKGGNFRGWWCNWFLGLKITPPLIHSFIHYSTTWLATTCSWKGVAKLPYPKKAPQNNVHPNNFEIPFFGHKSTPKKKGGLGRGRWCPYMTKILPSFHLPNLKPGIEAARAA